jgi:DNA-binding helix-hairpin-helix protein with protein kinase domain
MPMTRPCYGWRPEKVDVWIDSGAQLTLDKRNVLGSGVSGTVYPHPTDSSLCLKIYHPNDAAENAPKIRAMLAKVPDGIVDRNTGRHQAAWPLEVVRDAANAIGFVMPRVDFRSTQSLTGVFNLAETDEVSRKQLLVAAVNIVSLVANMHRAGHHLIDFNPENFRIHKSSGVLTLVDCDGFQITEPGGHRLAAPAAWIDT